MEINEDESRIVGHWIFDGFKMIADNQCERIDWLRNHYLKQVAIDSTGWLNLYQDPEDRRYWQLQFEHGEMQGGGPPSLGVLTELEAHAIYDF